MDKPVFGTEVNPGTIRQGDHIAVRYNKRNLQILASREVKKVEPCSKPEMIHLDNECYDTRFSTVVKK